MFTPVKEMSEYRRVTETTGFTKTLGTVNTTLKRVHIKCTRIWTIEDTFFVSILDVPVTEFNVERSCQSMMLLYIS